MINNKDFVIQNRKKKMKVCSVNFDMSRIFIKTTKFEYIWGRIEKVLI